MSSRGPSTGYVDRLLARADGALATIWITGVFVTRDAVDRRALERGLALLIDETPRLRMAFDERRKAWRSRETGDPPRVTDEGQRSLDAHTSALLGATIDLTRDVPFRVSTGRLDDGRTLVGIQLHHSVGDGRASLALTRRLFELAGGERGRGPLEPPRMTDAKAFARALREPWALLAMHEAKYRVLARRGRALRKAEGAHVGAPTLDSVRARFDESVDSRTMSGAYFGALLALATAMHSTRSDAPLRLRIPVDLRPRLGIGESVENACSALSIELDPDRVSTLVARGKNGRDELTSMVPKALGESRARGLEWGTLVECMAVSRLATRAMLRDHLRPDLLSEHRANTLVTTYLGNIAPYVQNTLFSIDSVQSHTPTWGSTGFRLGHELTWNLACFEGIWDERLRSRAREAVERWLFDVYGVTARRVR